VSTLASISANHEEAGLHRAGLKKREKAGFAPLSGKMQEKHLIEQVCCGAEMVPVVSVGVYGS